jgi:hypothetical protein
MNSHAVSPLASCFTSTTRVPDSSNALRKAVEGGSSEAPAEIAKTITAAIVTGENNMVAEL